MKKFSQRPPVKMKYSEILEKSFNFGIVFHFRRLITRQPLDAIRDYFGEQIAFYFAFVGFYTSSLAFPAILGLIVFLYGTIHATMFDETSQEICERFKYFDVCRLCPDTVCPYSKVGWACSDAKLAATFDNWTTVLFAIVIAIWSILLLERWKRREARLCAHWFVGKEDALDEVRLS